MGENVVCTLNLTVTHEDGRLHCDSFINFCGDEDVKVFVLSSVFTALKIDPNEAVLFAFTAAELMRNEWEQIKLDMSDPFFDEVCDD